MGVKRHLIKWNDFFERQPNKMVAFRVIPKTSLTNSNNNKKMWRYLNDMYRIYEKKIVRIDYQRRKKLGFKVSYREKDTIWCETLFTCEEGKKKIEFYLVTTELFAEKFKQVIESKMAVTLEAAELNSLKIPVENTIVQEMRYTRNDIFSLNNSAQEQNTPISTVLSTVNSIQDGDIVRLSMCNEVMNRNKWLKLAEYAHEKLKQGKTPGRNRISANKALKASGKVLGGIVNEANSLILDALNALQNTLFKGYAKEGDFKKDKLVQHKDIEEVTALRISNRTREKQFAPIWKSHIRTAVHSNDKMQRELLSNQLSAVYAECGEDNEITGVKIRIRKRQNEVIEEMNSFTLSNRTKHDADANIMSSDEIAKLNGYPSRELQQQYKDELNVYKKVDTDIPAVFKTGKGIPIGHATETGGAEQLIDIPVSNPDEFFKGYVFQGGMGAGKDTKIQNFVVEANIKHNISFVVIDQVNKEGRGGLANGIRDSLPADKIIDLDFANEDYLIPLDLTEVINKLGRRGADRFAAELIDFFGDVESMGQSRRVLREFAKASKGSLYNIKVLLESEEARKQRIEELLEEGNERLAESLYQYMSEYEEDSRGNLKLVKDGQKTLDRKAEAILNRLDEFLGDDALYNIFSQPPKQEMNFEKWMKEGKVIICRVPDRILSTVAVRTLVHWITLKTLMTRLLMSNESQSNGAFMIFNEPQTYMNHGLMKLMSRIAVQGRKERLGSMFAFHHIGHVPNELANDLRAGGVHWFLFKNDKKEVFDMFKEELTPVFHNEEYYNIPKYHAINILNFGGETQQPFMIRALPPSYERYEAHDNSFLTKRQTRQYGRHWKEIEKTITGKVV